MDKSKIETPYAKLKIYDDCNNEVNYATSLKTRCESNEINDNIKKAFVSVEDKRFYTHNGLDYIRIGGAIINNIKAGYIKEGGSTITQQLAKNSLLTNEKTLERKLREAKLAKLIEKDYTKDEILTMYLNTIYFGNGLYGINSASNKLFGKQPSTLNLSESAMLAGIVKNPKQNSPLWSKENATKRMETVLTIMYNNNIITKDEYDDAINYNYTEPKQVENNNTFRYQSEVIFEAKNILNTSEEDIISNNYKIYTFLDKNTQESIEKILFDSSLSPQNGHSMLMVANNNSGGIVAYSATHGYSVYELKRQPASIIKPIAIYLPALEYGVIYPSSPVLDVPKTINGYSPSNYNDYYLGWTNIRNAICSSSNIVAVETLNNLGINKVKNTVSEWYGWDLSKTNGLSLALGGLNEGLNAVELSKAYMSVANKGMYKEIGFIKSIVSPEGKTIYVSNNDGKHIFSEESAYLLTDMLKENAKTGTAKKLQNITFDIASKTGTAGCENSDDNTDAWNISYTTKHTVCSWYGTIGDNNKTIPKDISGGTYPTLSVKYTVENLYKNDTPDSFYKTKGIVYLKTDLYIENYNHIIMLASNNTPQKYQKSDIYSINNMPTETSTFFDNMQPRIKTTTENNEIVLQIDVSSNFQYELYKKYASGEILLCRISNSNSGIFFDDNPELGINRYYMKIFDKKNELIDVSNTISPLYIQIFD